MENEKNSLGSFKGLDISSIEEGLGMLLSGSGDPGKAEKKVDIDKPTVGLVDFTQKIEIPETPEEAKIVAEKQGVIIEEGGEKKEIEDNNSGEEDAVITEDSPLYLHAATLHEEGILPTLDLESLKGKKQDEALQIFLEAQKKYIEDGRKEFAETLSDRQKQFLELIENGVPEEQAEHQFNIEDSYGKVTDELLADDSELQEQIVVQSLKLKGLSDKQVGVFLKAAKDDERLFEEAKEARGDINTFIAKQRQDLIKQAEEEERAREKNEQELIKTIKTTIDSTEEIFPGMKISAAEKTKLYELMTKPVEIRSINGQKVPVNLINKIRSEDRISFDMRLNYFIEQGMFKKDFDLSKLSKKLTSTAASQLSKKLKEEPGGPSGKGLTVEKKKEEITKQKIIFPKF